MSNRSLRTSRERGQLAEDVAARHLEAHGLRPLTRNYQCPRGEVDLIMQDKEFIVFVEVRYRANGRYVSAVESIDTRKQLRIIATSAHYLQTHRKAARNPCRFDVVIVSGEPHALHIEWIKDAFQA
ncbi:MAG: YraN family protein [Gammaproteobacteria bacterium]|nr:YraN family protein [Gammaproteobacteria bacterium]